MSTVQITSGQVGSHTYGPVSASMHTCESCEKKTKKKSWVSGALGASLEPAS